MLQNARIVAFTVSELLRENQQGGKSPHKTSWIPGPLMHPKLAIGKIFLLWIVGMVLHNKREVKNCWVIEEGDVSGDWKDDFVNK